MKFFKYKFIFVFILLLSFAQAGLLVKNYLPALVKASDKEIYLSSGNFSEASYHEVKNEDSEIVPFKPERIVIESLKIDLPVISVPLINGTWQVHAKVANFAEGTSLINGEEGNVGIFAHNRKDAFAEIKNLKQGDEIILSAGERKAVYEVESNQVVLPDSVSVFYPTKEPKLTLVTCDDYWGTRRFIIQARLIEME
jgi:LPXTG-site transpeptidase (sortase) family protein